MDDEPKAPDRGTVKIVPVYVGIHHYRDVYGSVCSQDVVGTPAIPEPGPEDLAVAARRMVDRFRQETDPLGFVRLTEPLVVGTHADMRGLAAELTYDVDALLVGTIGEAPLERYTLAQYGLPVLEGSVDADYLRALRVKRFLRQSRFLYVGEIPSFSAPAGPYDFPAIERRLGVRVRHIETNEVYRHFDRFTEEEVKRELDVWRGRFSKVLEPSEHDLMDATRVYLALRYLADREDANGLTVNCGRFTEERPVVPCLAFDRLIDEGIMCACEGDITAMLSALIVHAVSGRPMLMGNFGSAPGRFEAEEGEVTIEHDLIPLSMAQSGYTIRDYHGRKFGVTAYADIKAKQPVTLLNVAPSLDTMSVLEGTTRYSKDGIHCRIVIHLSIDGDVKKVPEVIVGSQHVSMVFGRWSSALRQFGDLMGFEVRHL